MPRSRFPTIPIASTIPTYISFPRKSLDLPGENFVVSSTKQIPPRGGGHARGGGATRVLLAAQDVALIIWSDGDDDATERPAGRESRADALLMRRKKGKRRGRDQKKKRRGRVVGKLSRRAALIKRGDLLPAFDGKPRKSAIIRGIRALLGFLNCENNDVAEEEIFIPGVSVGGFRLRGNTRRGSCFARGKDFFERGGGGEFEEDPVSRGKARGLKEVSEEYIRRAMIA